jgi:hypothetical protein
MAASFVGYRLSVEDGKTARRQDGKHDERLIAESR